MSTERDKEFNQLVAGILRKDGSISIPATLRKRLNLHYKDKVTFHVVENNTLAVSFKNHFCPVCENHSSATKSVGGFFVCFDCYDAVLEKIREGKDIDTSIMATMAENRGKTRRRKA